MTPSLKITLIGTGRVASHLAPALESAGQVIHEIYGRNAEAAEALAENLYSPELTQSLDFSGSTSRLFLLAVSDGAIESVASEIILPEGAMIVHTSGTVPLEALEITAAERYGVLYPLQSFTKGAPLEIRKVPFFVEANTGEGEELLLELARSLSDQVEVATSEKRLKLHLAAVFVNNFINYLLTVGQDLSRIHGTEFSHLEPLIRETIRKALAHGPEHSQTGPAIREDYQTMEKHLELLSDQEAYQKLYKLLSQSIIDRQYE